MKAELINKYLKGDALPHEKEEILLWIEQSAQNRKQFMQFRRLYDISIWNETKVEVDKPEVIKGFRISKGLKQWMKVAAIITVTVTVTLLAQLVFEKQNTVALQTIDVPQGQHVNLTLGDGTKVALNSNSKLQIPSDFDDKTRTVKLNGEAYFEVSHNTSKPFHVITQKYDIKVLGTTFNVLAYYNSDVFETSLLEGSVQLADFNSTRKLVLKPNEMVQLVNNELVVSAFESEDSFLWKDGIYVFKNENFKSIFKKLEMYYGVEILVENSIINTYTCTGKILQKEGINHVLSVLQITNDFQFQRDGQSNRIKIY